ncbi:MAG: glycosyltransferase [Acidobacteriota bacterium]|nr:glycosyltransferase [Acidobacteriota bacterium]
MVLSVAYPLAPVSADAVGGAEQVLRTVEAGLVQRGFRSVVVAKAGSSVAGELLGVEVSSELLTETVRARVEESTQRRIDEAFARFRVDLVHMHGVDFYRYRVPGDCPVLVTLHLPPGWYPKEIWSLPKRYRLQCVSESQRQACPDALRARVEVVGNGVALPDVDVPERERRKGRFGVMLSRICVEKNLHVGLDAARAAGMPVILAGQVFAYPEHMRYFACEVEPRLGRGARFVGPVGGAAKARLLGRARCLLLPTLAPETSSLVAMEAFAAGTPVVAMRSGAIPEIVEDGLTGFLVDDGKEMTAAIARVGEIDGAVCRRVARERFSAEGMVERYVELYRRLHGLPAGPPTRRAVTS